MIGWYDVGYHSFWADSDMALRTWQVPGGRCEMSPGCFDLVSRREAHGEAPDKSRIIWQDMATFQSRWGDSVGRGWGREMKDFNIDLRPHHPLECGLNQTDVATLQAELQQAIRTGRMPAPENAPELGRPKKID